MQRIALAVQILAELAIFDPGLDSHRVALAIQGQHLIEMLQRDLILGGVGDAIERMAAAKRPQLAAADHQLLKLLDRFGSVQSGGAVGVVAGPVASILQHLDLLVSLQICICWVALPPTICKKEFLGGPGYPLGAPPNLPHP